MPNNEIHHGDAESAEKKMYFYAGNLKNNRQAGAWQSQANPLSDGEEG